MNVIGLVPMNWDSAYDSHVGQSVFIRALDPREPVGNRTPVPYYETLTPENPLAYFKQKELDSKPLSN